MSQAPRETKLSQEVQKLTMTSLRLKMHPQKSTPNIDEEGQEVKQYDHPCLPPVISGCVPFCIPKLCSVRVITRSLQNTKILESLRQYHDVAYWWATAVQNHKTNTKKYSIINIDKKFYSFMVDANTTYLFDSMITPTIEDDKSDTYRAVKNHISLIMSVSTTHTKRTIKANAY